MGFSAIEGLPTSTRIGAIDAGLVLHLLKADRMDPAAVESLLALEQSGLLGISGVSGDMRVTPGEPHSPEAAEAIDYFVYHIVKFIGAYTAVLGGLDTLIFTAGIGENSPHVRTKVCEKLRMAAQSNSIRPQTTGTARGTSVPRAASRRSLCYSDERGVDDRPAHAGAGFRGVNDGCAGK